MFYFVFFFKWHLPWSCLLTMDGLPTVYRELLDKAFHISRVTEARDFVSNRSGFGILNSQAMVVFKAWWLFPQYSAMKMNHCSI